MFACERPGLWLSVQRDLCLWQAFRGSRQADWTLCRTGGAELEPRRRGRAWSRWAVAGAEIVAALWAADPAFDAAVRLERRRA